MSSKSLFILLFSLSLLPGCSTPGSEPENFLPGTWKISNVVISKDNSSQKDPLLSEAVKKTMLELGVSYCFFPDGKAGEIFNKKYKPSSWKYNPENRTIVFPSQKKNTVMVIDNIQEKNARLYMTLSHPEFGKLEFVKRDTALVSFKEDPYYPSNNLWRIKPDKEESEKEIKTRLKNFIQHYCYILKAAQVRNSQIISFENSMGIIQIYNGAIGIVPKQHVPQEWFNNFYNDTQAYQAYNYFEEYIDKTEYHGAHSNSWVTSDYNILLAIYKTVEEDLKKLH